MLKTDALGNMQWNRKYGETGGENHGECASSMVATSDGGYSILGTFNFMGGYWLVKTDSAGNTVWNRTYANAESASAASSLVATSDGGYAIAGYTMVTPDYDCWLAKTDGFGNMSWNQTYVEARGSYDEWALGSLGTTSDGGYMLAGRLDSPIGAGDYDFWFVKTNELGVVPEFCSWLIPSVALATIGLVVLGKNRLPRRFCVRCSSSCFSQ